MLVLGKLRSKLWHLLLPGSDGLIKSRGAYCLHNRGNKYVKRTKCYSTVNTSQTAVFGITNINPQLNSG